MVMTGFLCIYGHSAIHLVEKNAVLSFGFFCFCFFQKLFFVKSYAETRLSSRIFSNDRRVFKLVGEKDPTSCAPLNDTITPRNSPFYNFHGQSKVI